MAAGQGLGHQVRLIARVQLVAEVFDVPLDRPRRDAEFLRALLGRHSLCDALKHFPLPFGEENKVFLLARNVHHEPLLWENY